jgi:hypothetical protein
MKYKQRVKFTAREHSGCRSSQSDYQDLNLDQSGGRDEKNSAPVI